MGGATCSTFNGKDGNFITSDNGETISEDADFIALCDETFIGWIKFNGKDAPPDRVMGLLYSDFIMPMRDLLGDLDATQWEDGLSGAAGGSVAPPNVSGVAARRNA